jgi:hypothetical protein
VQNHYPRFRAGRPSLPKGQRKVSFSGTITPAQFEWLVQLGEGNKSAGLRKAIAIAMQNMSPELIAETTARLAADNQAAYAAKNAARAAFDAVYEKLQDEALAKFVADGECLKDDPLADAITAPNVSLTDWE